MGHSYGRRNRTDDRFRGVNYFFGMPYGDPGKYTHPFIGWPPQRFTDTFEYRAPVALAGRRPVLLYGDSFASCSESLPTCFEHFLDEDARFSGQCYLFNYAVGDHGVDQTHLTFKSSVKGAPRPAPRLHLRRLRAQLGRRELPVATGCR
jgi:hypothetical protein